MFYQGQRLQCSWLRHEDITKLWRWSRSFSLPHTFDYFRCSSDSLTPTFSSRTNSTRQFSTWCWKPDTTTRFSHRPCWLTPLSSDLGARGRVRARERADHLHPAQRQQHAGEARDEVDHQPSWLKRQHSSPLCKALSKPGYYQVYAPVGKSWSEWIFECFVVRNGARVHRNPQGSMNVMPRVMEDHFFEDCMEVFPTP